MYKNFIVFSILNFIQLFKNRINVPDERIIYTKVGEIEGGVKSEK